MISPKPIDHPEPENSLIGFIFAVLVAIILVLVVVILLIVIRNKRGRGGNVLDAFQHNFNPDTLGGADKRLNCNGMKVSSNLYLTGLLNGKPYLLHDIFLIILTCPTHSISIWFFFFNYFFSSFPTFTGRHNGQ